MFAFGEHAVLLFWRNAAESFFQDAMRHSPAKGLYWGYDTGYAAVPLGGKGLGRSDLGHGLRSPFRMVCRNFILPDLQTMSPFSPFSICATYLTPIEAILLLSKNARFCLPRSGRERRVRRGYAPRVPLPAFDTG